MKQKSLVVAAMGALALVYLINPTAGLLEFIPDNFPIFGNLDEAAATTLLLACLAYFGLDLTKFLKPSDKPVGREAGVVDVESQVINQPK
ncbi:MAG: YkvA family protein [Verrucomicrobiales bacterium]